MMNFSLGNNSMHNNSSILNNLPGVGIGGSKTPGSDKSFTKGGLALNTTSQTPGSVGRKATGKSRNITPSRNANFNCTGSKTPGGDRYIPSRNSEMHNEIAQYLIKNKTNSSNEQSDSASQNSSQQQQNDQNRGGPSPQKQEFQRLMSESLNGGVTSGHHDSETSFRILRFEQVKPPLAPQGYTNPNAVLYSTAKPISSHKKSLRQIPSAPERILDAPDIVNDYYLNLLDWNVNNKLAVALAGQVFLWNSITGDIDLLVDLNSTTDYITSLSWIKDGNCLAIGTSDSTVQLWDAETRHRLRCMAGHVGRVGALSWNSYVLSSGDKNGCIQNNDVRSADHLINVLNGHTQEICGLKWSPNGRYLASGGNDNYLNIWPQANGSMHSENSPLFTLTDHQAAVKALAWCPWQNNVLASGGGTADRHIRLWNCNTGNLLSAHDTQSQVCSLLWSSYYKELISAHGFPSHQLTIWKYPQMQKLTELKGHTDRILHTAMSPCGEFVVSAAADESLRIWNCFKVDPEQKKLKELSSVGVKKVKSSGIMPTSIR